MREEERLSETEREAEAALFALRPARPAIDLQRIAIEAARRSALRQVWAWRGIAAALGAGLVLVLVLRPGPRAFEKYVDVRPPEAAPHQIAQRSSSEVARTPAFELLRGTASGYPAIRDHVLVLGAQGLPQLRPQDSSIAIPDRVEDLKLRDATPKPSGMFEFLNWM